MKGNRPSSSIRGPESLILLSAPGFLLSFAVRVAVLVILGNRRVGAVTRRSVSALDLILATFIFVLHRTHLRQAIDDCGDRTETAYIRDFLAAMWATSEIVGGVSVAESIREGMG